MTPDSWPGSACTLGGMRRMKQVLLCCIEAARTLVEPWAHVETPIADCFKS